MMKFSGKASGKIMAVKKPDVSMQRNALQSLTQIGEALGSLYAEMDKAEIDHNDWPQMHRVSQLISAAHNTLDVAAGLLAADYAAVTNK